MEQSAVNLVYAAPVPYSSFAQRAHHFVAFCNRNGGGRTLWIDPYPSRLPRPADLRRSRLRSYSRADATVEKFSPPPWCADPAMRPRWLRRVVWRPVLQRVAAFVQGDDWMLAIGRPSLLALLLLERTEHQASCYDAMDDFPEFQRGAARALSRRTEAEIARRVDQIIVSSSVLRDKFNRLGHDAELVRNGLDPCQQPLAEAAGDERVFGYVGTIGDWFDWELVATMAGALPEVRFDLIGPTAAPPPAPLPGNVYCLGECASEEAPSHLRRFSAGLIPFKVNRLTAAVDPIKYYEYRAAGLPVISTEFGEMRQRGADPGVCLIDRSTDFRAVLQRLEGHSPGSPQALERFRKANSWPARFKQSSFLRRQLAGLLKAEG